MAVGKDCSDVKYGSDVKDGSDAIGRPRIPPIVYISYTVWY